MHEIFANVATIAKFANISCRRKFAVLQYHSDFLYVFAPCISGILKLTFDHVVGHAVLGS